MSFESVVVAPGHGQAIWQLGNRFTLKVAADQTQGAYSLLEQVCAGAPAPVHVHDHEEEAFYILEGSIQLYLGDAVTTAEAGSFCLVPRGTPHTFESTGASPARMLVIISPPGLERFFAEVEERFPEADGMPTPDVAGPALTEMAQRYGLRLVGPPPN